MLLGGKSIAITVQKHSYSTLKASLLPPFPTLFGGEGTTPKKPNHLSASPLHKTPENSEFEPTSLSACKNRKETPSRKITLSAISPVSLQNGKFLFYSPFYFLFHSLLLHSLHFSPINFALWKIIPNFVGKKYDSREIPAQS